MLSKRGSVIGANVRGSYNGAPISVAGLPNFTKDRGSDISKALSAAASSWFSLLYFIQKKSDDFLTIKRAVNFALLWEIRLLPKELYNCIY